MTRTIHICQSIQGALKNWEPRIWRRVARDNNITVRNLKNVFQHYLDEGKKVLPIHGPCEGFSYQDGCPGHEVVE